MFELLVLIAFGWLSIKTIGLAFRVTWGLAKVVAGILLFLAFPALIGCFLVAGGIALLVPIALIGMAWAVLRACI